MLIAQISDLHYRPAGVRLFGYVDVHAAARRAVDALNRHRPAIDAVIVTGDLTNDGDAVDYEALRLVLDGLAMPYRVITGNHDKRELVHATFPLAETPGTEGRYVWVEDFGPLTVIGLDTLVAGSGGGTLGGEQLGWLDGTLAARPDRPTIVCLHHPPFATGITFMDAHPLADGDALADVLRRHDHVEAVLAGHVHRVIQRRFAGTIAMTTPGIAHQVVLDLSDETRARWIMEPAGFLLHRWDGNALVSHAAWLGDYGPEAPFHNGHKDVPVG